MLVSTAASGEGITLVASNSPPMPTSHTTMSHLSRANHVSAMAVTSSNSVGWSAMLSASGCNSSISAHSASSEMGVPLICIRSLKRKM